MSLKRHSIVTGRCYRDSFGAIWRVVSFDGNGVSCVLYHRDAATGATVERPHAETWENFLADLEGEVASPT